MAGRNLHQEQARLGVSTHSHPKVAGQCSRCQQAGGRCFNTQPPEGGWLAAHRRMCRKTVSTHSHPKVAGTTCSTNPRKASFQHTATRRWLGRGRIGTFDRPRFNTQPPEGGWIPNQQHQADDNQFQHTATRRWLATCDCSKCVVAVVSTHSHPKVAGCEKGACRGGTFVSTHSHPKVAGLAAGFNGADKGVSTHSHPKVAGAVADKREGDTEVSTHSHPKVAGLTQQDLKIYPSVSTHSHPKVAGTLPKTAFTIPTVSTHSHPKVAGHDTTYPHPRFLVSTHSHPKVAGAHFSGFSLVCWFQHTATRRWLVSFNLVMKGHIMFQHTATRRWLGFGVDDDAVRAVSTHSHPKVAGGMTASAIYCVRRFNTQPPEGGWGLQYLTLRTLDAVSTHSHPKVAGG